MHMRILLQSIAFPERSEGEYDGLDVHTCTEARSMVAARVWESVVNHLQFA